MPQIGDYGSERPEIVTLTPEAKQLFVEYYDNHNRQQIDKQGDEAAAWAKLEETPARLALVIHFVRWIQNPQSVVHGVVDAITMRAAIESTEWFKNEAMRIYAMLAGDSEINERERFATWVRERGGKVSPREVQQGCRWLRAPGAAEAALNDLVDHGYGQWENSETGTNGRPTRRFILNAVNETIKNAG
jgi:hypothetical protein